MSAFLVVTKSDCIDLVTDAAVYDADQNFLGTESKAHRLASPHCVIVTRGPAVLGPVVCELAARMHSFDEVFAGLDVIALEAEKRLRPIFGELSRYDILAAGWSDVLGRLFAGFISGVDCEHYPRLTAIGVKTGAMGIEGPEESEFPARWRDCPDRFDPERDGVPIFEAWRKQGPIGGYVQHTRVTRDSIDSTIIHRWPEARQPFDVRKSWDILEPAASAMRH